jgi:hypothetical protein
MGSSCFTSGKFRERSRRPSDLDAIVVETAEAEQRVDLVPRVPRVPYCMTLLCTVLRFPSTNAGYAVLGRHVSCCILHCMLHVTLSAACCNA